MSVNGLLQLKKLEVFYSNWGGSSNNTRVWQTDDSVDNGMKWWKQYRNLIESKQWAEWKSENPTVVVETIAKGNVHPYIRAHYVSGRTRTVCVKTAGAFGILKRANMLRDSRGTSIRTWVEKKRVVTSRPSIQGQWTPFFKFGGEPESTVQFKPVGDKYRRPKYQVATRKTEDYSERYVHDPQFKLKYHTRKAEMAAKRAAYALKSQSDSL